MRRLTTVNLFAILTMTLLFASPALAQEKEATEEKKMSMEDISKMLVGSWKIDEEATKNFEGNKDKEVDVFPPISVTMNEDGTGDFGEGSRSTKGTYEVREKEEGEGLELVTVVEGNERAFEFIAIDKKHFAMRPRSNMPYFVFKKEKKEDDDR